MDLVCADADGDDSARLEVRSRRKPSTISWGNRSKTFWKDLNSNRLVGPIEDMLGNRLEEQSRRSPWEYFRWSQPIFSPTISKDIPQRPSHIIPLGLSNRRYFAEMVWKMLSGTPIGKELVKMAPLSPRESDFFDALNKPALDQDLRRNKRNCRRMQSELAKRLKKERH